jgi:hypothetical protein
MTESEAAVGGKRVCVLHQFNLFARLSMVQPFRVCIGTRDVIHFRFAREAAGAIRERPRAASTESARSFVRARSRRRGFAACLVLAGAIGLSVATENCTSVRFRSRGSVVLDAPVHGFQFRARRSASGALTGLRGSRLRPVRGVGAHASFVSEDS